MSILRTKQNILLRKIAVLVLVAQEFGWELSAGDFYRDPRCDYGHPRSAHKSRLAADLNLFIDGEYIRDGRGHDVLHEIWSKMGGSDPIKNDPNHYSLKHKGVR